jgi:hypothetical protein
MYLRSQKVVANCDLNASIPEVATKCDHLPLPAAAQALQVRPDLPFQLYTFGKLIFQSGYQLSHLFLERLPRRPLSPRSRHSVPASG